MDITITPATLDHIQDFRVLFLQENNFQFVGNKCHEYGWADSYLFTVDGEKAGYGAVWGSTRREERDAIFEFYVLRPFREWTSLIFTAFQAQCGATFIECQSNDQLLSAMLYEHARNIRAEAVLFEDTVTTHLSIPEVVFRRRLPEDNLGGDAGDYVLESHDRIVATGGLMLNYNLPYADVYMEVDTAFREKGFGSLLVQEIKKEAYQIGRVPAARCNINNKASKATLLKAGFNICGFLLLGDLHKEILPDT
ncbi:GNAT family N-acetyltransferase [Chitinophaga nivalis]|uniref:GNAT family N-acetyltransferase n=1 Tax=Chitinophaga nivalis TaxID=2991709 RepID=A0ABT3II21_9BACT|nr:GNAT family N-acetyltransferase [Chitinophaga nivalis]MCW3466733.1 GNAT family N-acetyltransferase [Chitinophaga nivalis]MCW3483576.1 GNAT family N-acetyltransferase [Chitinophaga nivalis]